MSKVEDGGEGEEGAEGDAKDGEGVKCGRDRTQSANEARPVASPRQPNVAGVSRGTPTTQMSVQRAG